ncbi:hypothetical protein ACFFLM_05225 [Deinococcus oregonensis]|uniref:Uncharacterized protein n=1 Tax=Deinococcus oregonensis TaxID=1805970 RepID=A0ABV6AV51_9DEIO
MDAELRINEQAYREGYEAGRHADQGGPNWLLLTLLSGGAYLLLRPPERRAGLQAKLQAYTAAAQNGTLGEVAGRDLHQVQATVQQWREKAGKAAALAKKGQQVGHVAAAGVQPATQLAQDAQTILSSDDPQQVGLAVQDAKARLGDLVDTGREVTRAMESDGASQEQSQAPFRGNGP